MTHRQHATWLAWLDLQWNLPSRQDHYLARIAAEIRRVPFAVWGRSPQIEAKDFLLKFLPAGQSGSLSEEEQRRADMASKARWYAMAGKGHQSSRTPQEEQRR